MLLSVFIFTINTLPSVSKYILLQLIFIIILQTTLTPLELLVPCKKHATITLFSLKY